jgi:peptide methionine sulfoxide reductase msrA/msrB
LQFFKWNSSINFTKKASKQFDFIKSEQIKMNTSVNMENAIFASGCFWGTEFYFQKAEGVLSTAVGFTGGDNANPTYQDV